MVQSFILGWMESMLPLASYVLIMTIYAALIYRYYTFIAAKDLFPVRAPKGSSRLRAAATEVLHYLVIFPLFVFFWFVVMAVMMAFLTKNFGIEHVVLASMAIVATIRITAYYHKALAIEVAKMIPFTMLGLFLIDGAYFSWSTSLERMSALAGQMWQVFSSLFFVVMLELVLRIASAWSARHPEQEDE